MSSNSPIRAAVLVLVSSCCLPSGDATKSASTVPPQPAPATALAALEKDLRETGAYPGIVRSLKYEGDRSNRIVIAVDGSFFRTPRQGRLGFVQVLQQAWAKHRCPGQPDSCHIRVEDGRGNRVAGSGMFGSVVSLEADP